MEEIFWKVAISILIIGGCLGLILFAQTNLFLDLRRWFWTALLGVGGFISFGAMIDTIDVDKPVFMSIYWSTIGYLALAVVLWLLAIASFRHKEKYSSNFHEE